MRRCSLGRPQSVLAYRTYTYIICRKLRNVYAPGRSLLLWQIQSLSSVLCIYRADGLRCFVVNSLLVPNPSLCWTMLYKLMFARALVIIWLCNRGTDGSYTVYASFKVVAILTLASLLWNNNACLCIMAITPPRPYLRWYNVIYGNKKSLFLLNSEQANRRQPIADWNFALTLHHESDCQIEREQKGIVYNKYVCLAIRILFHSKKKAVEPCKNSYIHNP